MIGTTDGEGWQTTPAPRPRRVVAASDGRRHGVRVEMPVMSQAAASWLYLVLAVWLLAGAVGFTVVGVLVQPLLLVMAAVVGVLGLAAAVGFVRIRASDPQLRFGLWLWPEGLTAVLPGGAVELAWDDVTAVHQRWSRRSAPGALGASVIDWIVLETPRWPGAQRAGVRGVPLATSQLEADPELVLAMLRHYLAHPADRGELADGRAADRFGLPWPGG
ncbi:hypothetical protein [uncultured Nocardioides sp.]|uniref:hypothetical protein n=1 Tax=uncultured Nocardioides sp. TaxID=198441 RepID=UPI00260C8009|nr:hypothetical protein [uncultured Nocardioides sp.]